MGVASKTGGWGLNEFLRLKRGGLLKAGGLFVRVA